MLITTSSSLKKENSSTCTVREYEVPSTACSFAKAIINGRYPTEKRVRNTACEEIYYIISGSGIIHSEKGDFPLSIGDVYFFEKGEIYRVEGKNLELALFNAPKRTLDQYQEVE